MRCVRGVVMVVACAGGAASAQWSDDPLLNTPVVVQPGSQDVVKLAVAPDGSSWIGWHDFAPGGITVRVQRLDAQGNASFAPEGLLVSDNPQNSFVVDWDLGADASGNAMVTFVDTRNGGDFDVYAYLISPAGAFLWGDDGVTISDNADFEADPRIEQIAADEYVVVWPRLEGTPGLHLQRLNAEGAIQLNPGGVVIAGNGVQEPAFSEIIPTGDGGFFASWVRDTATFASPRFVDAQRFNRDGDPQWGATPVAVNTASVVPIAHRPRLIADGAGGIVIAWHDTRDGDFDCYVQRYSGAGVRQFAVNGVAVSTEPGRQQLDPAVAVAPGGDVMVAFRNTDSVQNLQGLRVQRFDGSGARALGAAGVELLPFDNQFNGPPVAVSDAGGIAVLSELEPGSSIGNTDGVLQLIRVDTAGAIAGGVPIDVSTTLSQKSRRNLARTPSGGFVAAWADDRAGNIDVYAQNVNPDGSLGGSCLADIAPPFGVLDLADVQAFIAGFLAQNPIADLAPPIGVWDLADLQAFVASFNSGCP